ncbi:hypothetical protein KSP40_PGU014317 [Platanthera guangdongensis]|uniref:Phosphatidate phosphatase n=1 Tax=Platanthera guangdongensis TaxID=2320717 RepID=A0ABR2MRL9_9ASPA
MNAMGMLGSYISRGVHTVSDTFHPFGGAVDIIVVQQPDGSFKSSPWYIRFGKFQGFLKTKEKIVSISVNGVEAGIHMYLDHRGEAHFLKEIDIEEGELAILPQTSGDREEEEQFRKVQSCNHECSMTDLGTTKFAQNGKILARTSSRRSNILGLMFGRRSIKGNEMNGGVARVDSLERAKIAANLLELKWSTNLMDNSDFQYNPINEDDSSNKSTDLKGGKEEIPHPDVEHESDEIADSSDRIIVHNFSIESEHFEERIGCDSVTQGAVFEVSASEREDIVLGTISMEDSNCRNSGRNMETHTHFQEELACASGLSGQEAHVISVGSSRLLTFPPISSVPEELKENTEILNYKNSIGLQENFGLTDSVSVDSQTMPSSDGAFPSDEVLAEFGSRNSSQNALFEKHIQENDRSTTFCSNQQDKEVYLHESPNESSQLHGVENFGVNARTNCYLSNTINISQDYDTTSELLVVESREKSSDSEEDLFLFSHIDGFGFNEAKLEASSSATDEKEKPQLLYADDDSVEGHALKDGSGEDSSEDLLEESITSSSPIKIPRFKTSMEDSKISPKSLPTIRSCIHDLERSHKPSPLSTSLDVSFAKSKCHLSKMECSTTLNMEDDSQTNLVQENCTYEAVASTFDIKNGHVAKGMPICPILELSLCRHLLYEGMGLGAASQVFNSEKITVEKFHALGPPLLKNDKLVARIGGCYLPWSSAAPMVLQIITFGEEPIFKPQDVIMVERVEKKNELDVSFAEVSSEGSWKLWPFGFSRSKTIKAVQFTRDGIDQLNPGATSTTIKSSSGDDCIQKIKNRKKKVRWLTPSSEELAALNLKEGSNVVTFRFSTAMLGLQQVLFLLWILFRPCLKFMIMPAQIYFFNQVDARIYLLKWNTRIVISDVDGTITR